MIRTVVTRNLVNSPIMEVYYKLSRSEEADTHSVSDMKHPSRKRLTLSGLYQYIWTSSNIHILNDILFNNEMTISELK